MCSVKSTVASDGIIQAYLDYLRLEKRHSEHTVLAVRRDLALLAGPLNQITASDLKAVLAQRHAKGIAPATLARTASSWRGLFKFLLDHGHLTSNPALGIKTPKLPKRLPKAVGVDSLLALLDGPLPEDFRHAQAHVLIELLYCTGLRISEAIALTVDLLAENHEIRVLGKGGKTRVVPIVDALKNRLREFAGRRMAHQEKCRFNNTCSLFLSLKGSPLSARQAQLDVAKYAQLKGLGQHLHPHMLRHSFASHVLQGTQNLRAVQELLGHSSIASTQVYTALDFDHLSSVYDKAFPRATLK